MKKLSKESKAEIESILDRALDDVEFRELLMENPEKALKDAKLTPQEKELVGSLKRVALEEYGINVKQYRAVTRDNGFKLTAPDSDKNPDVQQEPPKKGKN